MSEETVPYGTKCCDSCGCGGGCQFAQAAVDMTNPHDVTHLAHDALKATLDELFKKNVELRDVKKQHAALVEALSDARDILASPPSAYDQRTHDAVLAAARAVLEEVK